MQHTPDLPTLLTPEYFQTGQATSTKILKIFVETLFSSGLQKDHSEGVKRQVASLSQDILNAVTKGRVKPSKHQKRKEKHCTRDIFGQLLFLAASQNVDLGIVVSHPLTPVSLSLCHISGAMNKTDKPALMRMLDFVHCNQPHPNISVAVSYG